MVASTPFFRTHFFHHARFYLAVAVGVAAYFAMGVIEPVARVAAAGDAFFLTYLIATTVLVLGLDAAGLQRRAEVEDEGGFIVMVIALAVIVLCVVGIFTVLNQKHASTLTFVLSAASAPLGWATLHVIAAFRYASLHFMSGKAGKGRALKFPGTADPVSSDFLYFSFVVGMTAQVSDVQVETSAMRRATLAHSVVSFFFNTVLIAMAVNAVVASAS